MPFIISLWITTGFAQDEHYYSVHPDALRKVIVDCPKKQANNISCEQLNHLATQLNELAYQLRSDPQGYGKRILALQETIAKQETALDNTSEQAELVPLLNENKLRLEQRIAVVKWLESPRG